MRVGKVANGVVWIGLVAGAFFAGRATAQAPARDAANVSQDSGPTSTPRPVRPPAVAPPGAEPLVPSPMDVQGSVAPLVNRVKHSVVSIHTSKVIRRVVREDPFSQFLRERLGGGQSAPEHRETQTSLGSGFLIDKQGTILTNNHVVAGADEVVVTLDDERSFSAKVLGNDPATDVAVVKIDKPPTDLRPAALGNSDEVSVGDYALAIGNPLGLGQTVTMGIVSAKNRSLGTRLGDIEPRYQDFIQTDAAINQGNSGGPLFDFRGQVVGVNSAILNPALAMNVGFAIPINLAQRVATQLQRSGRVARGYLGLSTVDLTPDVAARLKLEQGALVRHVVPNSAAARAGLRPNDVVVEIGGQAIDRRNQLAQVVDGFEPGSKMKIAFMRGGQRFETEAVLEERAAGDDVLGVRVAPVSAEEARAMGLRPGQGLRVVDVNPAAFTSGELRRDDLILAVNQTPATLELLKRLEQVLQQGGWGRLIVQRGGQQFVLTVTQS